MHETNSRHTPRTLSRACGPPTQARSTKGRYRDGNCGDLCKQNEDIMNTTETHLRAKAALRRIPYRPTGEQANEQFPFLLVTGRTLYQFNAGTMTMRTPNVELRPADVLEISTADAVRMTMETRRARTYLQPLWRSNLTCKNQPSSKYG